MEFEWDVSKEHANIKKHGVTFFEATSSFYDGNGIQLVDKKHSKDERRYYWVGRSDSGRVLTTWFTKRGSKIRIVGSAEWRKLRRLYEATKNK